MKFPGISRERKVYPVWFLIYVALAIIVIHFNFKRPWVFLILALIFSLKTILFDFKLIKMKRKRVYWSEHGPLLFLMAVIGILGMSGIKLFEGYIDLPTTIIAFTGFVLDLFKDAEENPRVTKINKSIR